VVIVPDDINDIRYAAYKRRYRWPPVPPSQKTSIRFESYRTLRA
jgi:hypothetical protein